MRKHKHDDFVMLKNGMFFIPSR